MLDTTTINRADGTQVKFADCGGFKIGDWWWTCDPNVNHAIVLRVCVPFPGGQRPFEICWLYMARRKNNWARPGFEVGWDGNRESPTLSPSITVGDWHGWFVDGELSQSSPQGFEPCPLEDCFTWNNRAV